MLSLTEEPAVYLSPSPHASASLPPVTQAYDPIQANGMCRGDSQAFLERIFPWQMHTGDTPLCQRVLISIRVLQIQQPFCHQDQAYELKLEKVWVFEDIVKTTLNMSAFRLQVA